MPRREAAEATRNARPAKHPPPFHFRTHDVADDDRVRLWTEAVGRFAHVVVRPHDPETFHGECRVGAIGLLEFICMKVGRSEFEGAPAPFSGAPRPRDADAPAIAIIAMLRGHAELTHSDRTSALADGDIVLCDAAAPMRCRFGGDSEVLLARALASDVSARIPNARRLSGRALRKGHGLTDMAFAVTRSLAASLDEDLPPHAARAASGHLLDVLATACGLAFGHELAEPASAAPRRTRLLRHIESNLHDPNLSPRSVAAAMGLSERYLHTLMSETGESVVAYVMRRRLEECAKQLAAAPGVRPRTISDIAASWGFKSDAHFSRVFKRRYGMTARDYRSRRRSEPKAD